TVLAVRTRRRHRNGAPVDRQGARRIGNRIVGIIGIGHRALVNRKAAARRRGRRGRARQGPRQAVTINKTADANRIGQDISVTVLAVRTRRRHRNGAPVDRQGARRIGNRIVGIIGIGHRALVNRKAAARRRGRRGRARQGPRQAVTINKTAD
ncbi:MAG: hypothetical protein AN485_24635, partial [Anabaena sp. MDT14b]